jgi:hypothetical protein
MKTKRLLSFFAILVGLAQLSTPVEAASKPVADIADRIASFVQGQIILSGSAIYYAAKVKGEIAANGELTLEMEVDPLFLTESNQGPYRADNTVDYWDLSLLPNAECGPPSLPTRITSTDISVKSGGRFYNLRDALDVLNTALPPFQASNRPLTLSEKDSARVRGCAQTVATKVDAMPFDAIQVHAGETLLAEVHRTIAKSKYYEFGGDNPVTHISITPKAGRIESFSVEVQAASVMHCDYEGHHIELDNWKHGFSTATILRQEGQVFSVESGMLDSKPATFPSYTQTELRRAIRKHHGGEGIASIKEAKLCAPSLRGHRFTIKYGKKTVQEISVYTPGSC